jgi:Fur family ferric uptake transcriptional regulator
VTVPHLTPAVEASTAPAAFAAVRANGLRLSTARRLLLKALFESDRPLSAEELAGDGDVASAYRNLEVLEGLGLVTHVHLGHGPGRYQPAGRPREFVVCEGCGDVSPLAPAAVDAVRMAVLDAVGYRARFTHFPLAGLCPACSIDPPNHEETISHAHS